MRIFTYMPKVPIQLAPKGLAPQGRESNTSHRSYASNMSYFIIRQ